LQCPDLSLVEGRWLAKVCETCGFVVHRMKPSKGIDKRIPAVARKKISFLFAAGIETKRRISGNQY
jgi:hypothetical protein